MSTEFRWTDELVLEFLNAHRTSKQILSKFYWEKESVEAFKFSKASNQPKEDKPITPITPVTTKEYEQGFLDKPEWEIVEFLHGVRKISRENSNKEFFESLIEYPAKEVKIHSVKRLSDGEVFSVGDEVYRETDANKVTSLIEKFVFIDGRLSVATKQFSTSFHLIKKSKPKEEVKEPERISVDIIGEPALFQNHVTLKFGASVESRKFPLIKQAIEAVINNGDCVNIDKFIPKEQVDKMMEDAFNHARSVYPYKYLLNNDFTYQTFQDYKNTLK